MLGAIAAGNAVVIKPSEVVANTSSLIAQLMGDYSIRKRSVWSRVASLKRPRFSQNALITFSTPEMALLGDRNGSRREASTR